MIACPCNSVVKEGDLALVEWFSTTNVKCPIADGQPDVVETGIADETGINSSDKEKSTHPAAAMAAKSIAQSGH